jgi:hypothetical protein
MLLKHKIIVISYEQSVAYPADGAGFLKFDAERILE